MKTLDYTGLDASKSKKTVSELQQLLADLHVFYMNMRGYHWHIEGKQFFALHEKFEEIYDELEGQIDEVAERILMLGEYPESKFSEYLKMSHVKESGLVKDMQGAVNGTLEGYKTIINQVKMVAEAASQANDPFSEDLVRGFLGGYEKKVWMFVAFLK